MNQPAHGIDTELIPVLDRLIHDVGGDPAQLSGKLVRELIHTALKLLQDNADDGELKLVSRSLKELRYALKVFRDWRHVRKVSIFGSARTAADHGDYQSAVELSRKMAEAGWMIITGAGGGIMEAGHGGAGRDKSFGVAIRLPFETTANVHIEGDAKLVVFRYFFTRKLMFASQADAVVLFPGGFGTQDECFEILTLVQTGKSPIVPVVMVDTPGAAGGGDYWANWDHYVRGELLANRLISPDDLNLYHVTDSIDDAVAHVQHFYHNYHSQRFVRDALVLRLQRPITDAQLGALNEEFGKLVAEGKMQQGSALPEEHEHLDLPRLWFTHTKRDYGLLRLLIDRINSFST